MSKVLLIVNPSSGGEKPSPMKTWQGKSWQNVSMRVVVKHTEKAETQQLC